MESKSPYKIVISGGPGSGKTTLINFLKKNGFTCFKEISRDYIKLGKKQGIENYFKEKPHAFSEFLWKERKKQYYEALKLKTKYVFFDRALHDVIGYLNYVQDPNKKWEKELNNYKYNLVFLLKPVFQIYIQDEDRMETFEEAVEVHKSLEKTYHQSKLKIIKLPFTTPQKRFDLILKHCANELS